MTCSRTVEVSPGIIWETMSDDSTNNGPIVCIPISHIETMTNEQIGALARRAVWTAQVASACMIAANIIFESRFIRKPSDLLKHFEWKHLEFLYRFIGEDEDIDRAIDLLTPAIALQGQAEEKAKATKALRAKIAADYDRLFVILGRRDGFRCANCDNAGSDLQIDHIIPVSKGGTNEIENLQLLCRKCNIVKGART